VFSVQPLCFFVVTYFARKQTTEKGFVYLTPVTSTSRAPRKTETSKPERNKLQMATRISALVGVTTLLVLSMFFSTNAASSKPTLGTTAVAQSCGSICVQNRQFCISSCNGNQICLAQCQEEYECCQVLCHGGTCRQAKRQTAPSDKKTK
jgi:hypothetical protein